MLSRKLMFFFENFLLFLQQKFFKDDKHGDFTDHR